MTEEKLNFKFGIPGPNPTPYHYPKHVEAEPTRLVIGLQQNALEIITLLKHSLPEPLALLYVLNVPRDESTPPGRYQSPLITHSQVEQFLTKYQAFLEGDARHELWIYSEPAKTQIVYDFHDIIYYYSPDLNPAIERLKAHGYTSGPVKIPFPHFHPYHQEFDETLAELLDSNPWEFTPHPEHHEH